jgi:membrane protease subunit HflK
MKKIIIIFIPITIIIIICLILFFSSFYLVNIDEVGVVTRNGKYVKTVYPGLRFKVLFIDKVFRVKTRVIMKQEFGFKTISSGMKSEFYRGPEQIKEAEMVTADLNIIFIEWLIHYKINDPEKYLFSSDNTNLILRELCLSSMSKIIGDYLFYEIITFKKDEINEKVKNLIEDEINKLKLGIQIQTIDIINALPPAEVEASYNEYLHFIKTKENTK